VVIRGHQPLDVGLLPLITPVPDPGSRTPDPGL
jgi:hypothetical protein